MQSSSTVKRSDYGLAATETAVYVAALALAGAAITQMAANAAAPDWSKFSVLLLLSCGATRLRLRLPGMDRTVSLAFPFCFAAITEFSGLYALGLIAVVELFEAILEPQAADLDGQGRASTGLFRLAAAAVAVWAAVAVYRGLSIGDGLEWAIGSVAAATAYFVVISGFRSLYTGLRERSNPIAVWNKTYFWSSPIYLLAPLGVLVSRLLLEAESFWDTAVGLSVVGAAYWYLHIYFPRVYKERDEAQKLADIRQRALETLVVAIEAKDGSTAGHLQRVKRLAVRLGRRLECSADELRTLQLAAVLHDVGKVGVPDYILQKPSRLTDSEFEEVAAHAGIGANIVSTMDFPEPVDEVVLSHHEHWDGSGYPRGLAGEDIPKLGRILTVVDCFDALVSERPYRQALPIDAALELLRRQQGKIFDPKILDAFLEMAPEFAEELRQELIEESLNADAGTPKRVAIRQTWVEKDPTPPSPIVENLQRLGRRPHHLETLHEIMAELGAELDYTGTLESMLNRLKDLTGASSGVLFAADPRAQHLTLIASCGIEIDRTEPMEPARTDEAASKALGLDAASIMSGSVAEGGFQEEGSMLAAPMKLGDSTIGVIALSSQRKDVFTEDHALLLDMLRGKAAATLAASRQLEKLQVDASTDVTTGLPNSRAAFIRLDQEINRAGREQRTLGVLFMDLTGLKPVNDSYGHVAGDRLLAGTAKRLQDSLRSYDFVGRVGGDEFLALAPGVSRENLAQLVEQIKSALQESPVEVASGKMLRPVLSIGAALYPEEGATSKELLDLSDQRMYEDKERDLAAQSLSKPPARVAAKTAAQSL